MIAHIWSVA